MPENELENERDDRPLVERLHERFAAESESERLWQQVETMRGTTRFAGPPPSVDPAKIGEARWGVIVPSDGLPAGIESALQKLCAHRAKMMDVVNVPRFTVRPGQTFLEFLVKKAVEVSMDVERVPYYLCLAAPPSQISWAFQADLDREYAVGRFWFDDPADAHAYVDALIASEATASQGNRGSLLVGPKHPNDNATASSHTHLLSSLKDRVDDLRDVDRAYFFAPDATKANVLSWLRGRANTPSLLMTVGHGDEADPFDPAVQGAPILSDWPGPTRSGAWTPRLARHRLAASDMGEFRGTSTFRWTIWYAFACFSAGGDADDAGGARVSSLAQAFLAAGGRAFVGHVGRAWDYSYLGIGATRPQIGNIFELISAIVGGTPVGHATDYWNRQGANYAACLNQPPPSTSVAYVDQFTAWRDSRSLSVIGDPFASLT